MSTTTVRHGIISALVVGYGDSAVVVCACGTRFEHEDTLLVSGIWAAKRLARQHVRAENREARRADRSAVR